MCARVFQINYLTLRPNIPLHHTTIRAEVHNNKRKVMKTSKILPTLTAAILALMVASCTLITPISPNPNEVSFSTNDIVASTVKNQFLSIASDVEWSIHIDYLSPEGVSDWCKLSKDSGKGNDNVFMSFGENTLGEDRSLNIVVQFPNEKITLLFTQLSADKEDLSGWLELPAFEADGTRTYFSKHMLPSSGNTARSFSLFYDSDIYHSMWVAYPISKLHTPGGGKRADDWGRKDSNIPAEKQVYLGSSFNGNYDRGHLCPAATRFHPNTTENCRQLSMSTNMSPQLSGLNQQKWANIEGQVRNWGSGCDTLYVVTGAVFQTVGGNESISYAYGKSDSSKKVAVPNYYYKALLQLRITGGVKSYQALALWVPHKAASGSATMDDVITIDELERRTGMDFFVNLDSAIQESVESKVVPNFWGL